jgi:TatA/E family protein of Tat protein translocase
VFNIGPLELVVVLVIALIVLGPSRLPEVARSVGRGMREFRTALTEEHGPEDDEPDEDEPDHDGDVEDGEPKKLEASYQKDADSSESSRSSSERV